MVTHNCIQLRALRKAAAMSTIHSSVAVEMHLMPRRTPSPQHIPLIPRDVLTSLQVQSTLRWLLRLSAIPDIDMLSRASDSLSGQRCVGHHEEIEASLRPTFIAILNWPILRVL